MNDMTPAQRLGNRVSEVNMGALARLYELEGTDDDRAFNAAHDAADSLTRYAWQIGYAKPARTTPAEALAAWEEKGPTSLTVALMADALQGVREAQS